MSGLPDPVQIVAAAMRRFLPGLANPDALSEVLVHELQRNGWLIDWTPIRAHGAIPIYDDMGDPRGRR